MNGDRAMAGVAAFLGISAGVLAVVAGVAMVVLLPGIGVILMLAWGGIAAMSFLIAADYIREATDRP